MIFKRKAYDELLKWKHESSGKSAMLIEGARRVGKSTLAEEFAKNEYSSYLLIDFTKVSSGFKRDFLDLRGDLDSFFLMLDATFGTTLIPRYSLASLDKFSRKFGKRVGTEYVMHPRHLIVEGSCVRLPLYMAHLL